MNHLKYLDLLLEDYDEDEEGKWATVKKIKPGTPAPSDPNVEFIEIMKIFIGKRVYFIPSTYYKGFWQHHYTDVIGQKKSYLFDPAWLIFDDKLEEPNLFTRDPE
jgi:hypothetical protein